MISLSGSVAVRFQEMLASLLAEPDARDAARLLIWRELVERLAAGDGREALLREPGALAMIAALRDRLPAGQRDDASAMLWQRPPNDVALVMLGHAPMKRLARWIDSGSLDATQWQRAMPYLPAPLAVLLGAAHAASGLEEGFRFEAGSDGLIFWASTPLAALLLGQSIAFTPPGSAFGVDGQASGAFRQRAPFRDARLNVAGEGACAGEWRISASPIFSPGDGRFRGYRGTARRPGLGEAALPASAVAPGPLRATDTLRQFIHELRTPLTAIIGFSEVIERQLLGPAALPYRNRAWEIHKQGERLLAALEDLDLSSRLAPDPGAARAATDLAGLVTRLCADYSASAEAGGYRLDLSLADEPLPAPIDSLAAERVFRRLLDAMLAMAQRGETIAISIAGGESEAVFAVGRPVMLSGRDAEMLLDPAYSPGAAGEGTTRLGLGFSLRLVRNLAVVAGGRLEIAADAVRLVLPLATPACPLQESRQG